MTEHFNTGPLPVPRKVTVGGNTDQTSRLAEIGSFLGMLASAPMPVEIIGDFAAYLCGHGVSVPPTLVRVPSPSADSGLMITLGGDGTLLHAAPLCAPRGIPVVGLNTGHLGFLTTYTLSNSYRLLPDLLEGGLTAEPRLMIGLRCSDPGVIPADFWPYALNEAAVLKADTSSMINVDTEIDGHHLTRYSADGLIISTPTGSTGYNLSAGGPIVAPVMECLVLSPIAPHTLTMRPLVADAGSSVHLRVSSRAESFRVALDGRSFMVPCGVKLIVERAPFRLMLARRREQDYPSTLRSKLHWGA